MFSIPNFGRIQQKQRQHFVYLQSVFTSKEEALTDYKKYILTLANYRALIGSSVS